MDPKQPVRAQAVLRLSQDAKTLNLIYVAPLTKNNFSFLNTTYDAALTICALNGLPVSDLDVLLLRPEAFVLT